MTVPRIGFSIKIIDTKGPNTFKPLLSQRERRIQNVQVKIIPQITHIPQHNSPFFSTNPCSNGNNALGNKEPTYPPLLEHTFHSTNNNSNLENAIDRPEVFINKTTEKFSEDAILPIPCQTTERSSQSLLNENSNNNSALDYESYSRPYREAIAYLKIQGGITVSTTSINSELPLPKAAHVDEDRNTTVSKDESFWSRHRVKILTGSAFLITAAIVWYKKDAIVAGSQKFLGFWFRGSNSALKPQTPFVANIPNPNPIPQAPFVTNVVNSQPSNMPPENTVKTFQSLITIYKQRFPWTLENLKNSFKQYGKQLFIDLVDGKDIHPSEKSKAYGAYMYMLGADMLKKAVENGLLQIANGSYVRGPKWDCCLDDLIKKA